MKILTVVLAAAMAATLGACATTTPAQRAAMNTESCEGYGFKAGTDAYANCMMQLDIKERQADLEQRRRIGDAISEMGNRPYPTVQPIYSTPQIGPRTTTCNSRNTGFGNSTFGNSVQTTCTQY